MHNQKPIAQGPLTDLALHTLGWKSFQDLCAQIFEEVLKIPISIYREAQDGGQDAVFIFERKGKHAKGGTVQCKFCSDRKKRLAYSDFTQEINSISNLVEIGEADTYYFVTNMGIDAPVAAKIRKSLLSIGVKNPHILGKEWISTKIKESARLRALVPRVYGLGDLSTILDERAVAQTQALLGHLLPSLGVYVPTAAHRNALKVLKDHGIVLLLGAPATGKSMLAAILATAALDEGQHKCFQVDSPQELIKNWNPNEPGGFYWIDDAFGSNQLRDGYVDQWISIMNKVKTAIAGGNRFVLTSRIHIWNAAKSKLGTRNHPLLKNNKATVQVGALDLTEKKQILYNHIKNGNQTSEWKFKIKPYLDELSENTNFLPELARRLGERSYTKGLRFSHNHLDQFVSKPLEFLKETIEELEGYEKAALVLVFLHRSNMPVVNIDNDLLDLVSVKYDVSTLSIIESLNQMDKTFVVKKEISQSLIWTFIHPTISDALTSILGEREDLTELYLRGAKIETLLSETICIDQKSIEDAIVINTNSYDLLVSRLLEINNEKTLNNSLFVYLNRRCSDYILEKIIELSDDIFKREIDYYWNINSNQKVLFHSKAHKLRLLPEIYRSKASELLINNLFSNFDVGLFSSEDLLSLIRPTELIQLMGKILNFIEHDFEEAIEDIERHADRNDDPQDVFYNVLSFISEMENIFHGYSDIENTLKEFESMVFGAIDALESERGCEYEDDWGWDDATPKKVASESDSRSLFSDIDE